MSNAAGAVSSPFPTTPATINSTPTITYDYRDDRKGPATKSPPLSPSRNINPNRTTQNAYFDLPHQQPDVTLKDLTAVDKDNDDVNNDNDDDVSEAETIIQSAVPSQSREHSPEGTEPMYTDSDSQGRRSPHVKGKYDRLPNTSSSPAPSRYEQPRKKQRLDDGRPMDVSPLEGNIRSQTYPRRRVSSESARSLVSSQGSNPSRRNEHTNIRVASPSTSTGGHGHVRVKQEQKSSPSGRISPSGSASTFTEERSTHRADRADDRSVGGTSPYPQSLPQSQKAPHTRPPSTSPKNRSRSKSNMSGVTSSASSDMRREREFSKDRDYRSSASPYPSWGPRKTSSGEQRVSKRRRDQNGRTPLARACAAQEFGSVQYHYAETPSDLNVPDNAGNTPLQIASLEGSAEIVDFLINRGCEIETKNIDKDTPLIDAVENGHFDVVKILLNAGANPRVGNAQGDEPFDLVPSDCDHYNEIKQAIFHAKAQGVRRRKSEDHQRMPIPPPRSTRTSPPPSSTTTPRHATSSFGSTRRKTVRSEATRNDLLWTKPSFENLRHFAAKGDMEGVATILNVLQKADTESLIAAVKGGHDEVLGLLLGMGDPEPDPQPLLHLRSGYNTPMLAAIGRGNTQIIQLLLEQRAFNPTRKPYDGKTYYELSKARKGDNHEAEFNLLKKAYDNYSGRRIERANEDLKRVPDNERLPKNGLDRQQRDEGHVLRPQDKPHSPPREVDHENMKLPPVSFNRQTVTPYKAPVGESPSMDDPREDHPNKPFTNIMKDSTRGSEPSNSEPSNSEPSNSVLETRFERLANAERSAHTRGLPWDSSSPSLHNRKQMHNRSVEDVSCRDNLPPRSPTTLEPDLSAVKTEYNVNNSSSTDITMKDLDRPPSAGVNESAKPPISKGKLPASDQPIDDVTPNNRYRINKDSVNRRPDGFPSRERGTQPSFKADHDRFRRPDQDNSRASRIRREWEDKELQRRSLLPMRLSAAAKLIGSNDELARQPIWLRKFLPVFTATTQDIDEKCSDEDRDEKWVPNVLVAPLLATNDLQLSQYTAWEKRKATNTQRINLWRVCQRCMCDDTPFGPVDVPLEKVLARVFPTCDAFLAMEHIFWVKLSDFQDLVPHVSHLQNLGITYMDMHVDPEPKASDTHSRGGRSSTVHHH